MFQLCKVNIIDNSGVQKAKKVYWEDQGKVKTGRLEYTGITFVVLGLKVLDCQFGKDRHKKEKERRKKKVLFILSTFDNKHTFYYVLLSLLFLIHPL